MRHSAGCTDVHPASQSTAVRLQHPFDHHPPAITTQFDWIIARQPPSNPNSRHSSQANPASAGAHRRLGHAAR